MNTEPLIENPSFPKMMFQFFGKLSGQTLAGFHDELKALNDSDREFFRTELQRLGLLTEGEMTHRQT